MVSVLRSQIYGGDRRMKAAAGTGRYADEEAHVALPVLVTLSKALIPPGAIRRVTRELAVCGCASVIPPLI